MKLIREDIPVFIDYDTVTARSLIAQLQEIVDAHSAHEVMVQLIPTEEYGNYCLIQEYYFNRLQNEEELRKEANSKQKQRELSEHRERALLEELKAKYGE